SPFWTGTPFVADPSMLAFARTAIKLPNDRSARLRFFLGYLGDPNVDLAESAYSEFAAAPYEDVVALAPRLGRARVLELLAAPTTREAHKSVFYLMLGSFHQSEDLPLVEKALDKLVMTSPQSAIMSCYLELKGAAGLPMLESRFLIPSASTLSQRSALEAMRFQASAGKPITGSQVAPVFRRLLDDPELAPLVLRDLALWSDWEGLPKVVGLFDHAPTWSRVSIVRYLASCPLPEAKAALERIGKKDPQLVKISAKPFQ
ncbi:MAG: hypothetical protein KC910_35230, partial [Candidatus Eremiobacteraeota bacterium]|nr:hypothetical protein [Candidatus Eremiobacteraeota bacterium]